jgi:hypothetical protein
MKHVMLILALMGCVCANAQTKTNCKKNLSNKTVSDKKVISDKPLFTYKKNNMPVKSTAAINDNAELISFEAEGTYIARLPKTQKLASK